MSGLDGFKASILQVDSCIIAEDQEYAVVSARVPKAFIRTHQELLCALFDVIGPDHMQAPRYAPFAKKNRLKTGITLAAAVVLGIFVGDLVQPSGAFGDDPISIRSAKYLTGPDAYGVIMAEMEIAIARTCRSTIDAAIFDADQHTILRWSHPTVPRPQGEQNIMVTIHLPVIPEPGAYVYRARLNSFCGDKETAALVPDIPFVVSR